MPHKLLRGFFDGRGEMSADDVRVLYRWLSIPRYATILVTAVAIATFWLFEKVHFNPAPVLFGLVPAFLIVSVATEVLIRRNYHPLTLLRAQLFIDLIGVTVGVLLTGGPRSPFALLYILVVISASLLSVQTLIGFGVATAVLYEGVAYSARAGALGMSPADAVGAQDPLTFIVFILIVGLIAFQSSYYVSRIREKDEEVIKLKDEFLFRTIHDLRSPSIAIRYVLEKYKSDKLFASRPDVQKDFAVVDSSLQRMTLLIEDLLKIAAGDNPTFVVKQVPVDLRPLIREVAEQLAPLMEARHIQFTYDVQKELPPVIGDPEKLKETFNNFLDNAIKYNRDGGAIIVSHAVEEGTVRTEITDTGMGISERSLKKLFMPYFRGDVGNEIRGTGLGLYMTKKLVQRMRGDVEVRSLEGTGSTFTVSLPTTETT